MNLMTNSHSLSIKYILHMVELFSCFEYQIYKRGKFSIKLCKKIIMATCCFYYFNYKFLHEIEYVQSLKVMST